MTETLVMESFPVQLQTIVTARNASEADVELYQDVVFYILYQRTQPILQSLIGPGEAIQTEAPDVLQSRYIAATHRLLRGLSSAPQPLIPLIPTPGRMDKRPGDGVLSGSIVVAGSGVRPAGIWMVTGMEPIRRGFDAMCFSRRKERPVRSIPDPVRVRIAFDPGW
mgnify:CR=1 FL=1